MKKIILDTNLIIYCLEYKVDILAELARICDFPFQVCILDKTIDELKGKKLEKLALTFIKKLNIIPTKKDKSVDGLLLEQKDSIIATQDKILKEKLKKAGIPIIILRQKKYLMFENVLRNHS